jgi:large subunit ribosomal protein L4
MSATILTAEAAKAANIEIITNGKYTQAVHETVVAYRANRRSGTASVKTKATVNGSGSKPWKQKGTGRARAGYKQSPIWSGGGVVFGPHPRDYSKKISKQVRRIALRKALSARILAGDVLIVPTFVVGTPKTKEFIKLIGGISSEPKTLVVSTGFDDTTKLAARNVARVQLMTSADVNSENLLNYRKIVLTNDALTELAERINK